MNFDYSSVNRAHWDERAPAHAASPDYAFERFPEPDYLSPEVRFDLPRLGSLDGVAGIHLQCHIGTDTVSLARLGARMTGLDFSGASLREARRLAEIARVQVEYHEADVYDAPGLLGQGRFDLVYTGMGALCWLPKIDRWASGVAALLRSGGRLFMREVHPVLWSLALEGSPGDLRIEAPYFERDDPTVLDLPGTYVQSDAVLTQTTTHEWNHGMGEIVTALLAHGLTLAQLIEHDSVPFDALPGKMQAVANGEWQLIDRPYRLPHSYTLQAVKN